MAKRRIHGPMIERSKAEEARLAVSRYAADLFYKHGVDGTTGDGIAAASGLSKRTLWRYFRSKEACIEPLFFATELRFVGHLGKWPRSMSIETYLHATIASFVADDQFVRDAIAVVRIIAMLSKEPALRSCWLMACYQAEAELVPIVADRAKRSLRDLDVKLCAAMIMAAIRVVDEEICSAAVNDGQHYKQVEATDQLAAAIRAASTLPICDPVGR